MAKQNDLKNASTDRMLQHIISQNDIVIAQNDAVLYKCDLMIERSDKTLARADKMIEHADKTLNKAEETYDKLQEGMQEMRDRDALLEELIKQNTVVLESLGVTRDRAFEVPAIKRRQEKTEADSKNFKSWHKEHFKTADEHGKRLAKLENSG